MSRAAADQRASSDDLANVNALGMTWNSVADSMSCKQLPTPDPNQVINAQHCLSTTARLFDVPGLLLPVHVQAKLFLQQQQRSKKGWRDTLSDEDCREWTRIHRELCKAVSDIKWARLAIRDLTPDTPLEIHIFADASTQSYGASAFLVANNQSRICWAKNKLVPLKNQPTIPRLELNSCLLGSTLLTYIMQNVQGCVNVTKTVLWTDSQIVLCWLNSDKRLDKYITNRCNKIRSAGFSAIYHCPSRENPSDLLTRGISAQQLQDSNLWWHGPEWLVHGKYPTQPTTSVLYNVVRPFATTLPTIPEEDTDPFRDRGDQATPDPTCLMDPVRFSTMRKLLYATICVARFVSRLLDHVRSWRRMKAGQRPAVAHHYNHLRPSRGPPLKITKEEYTVARQQWVLHVQRTHFADEKRKLANSHRGPLGKQLALYLDAAGLIRKGSRIQQAHVSDDCNHPVLLPPDAHFTRLVI